MGMTAAIVLLAMHSTELLPRQFINHSFDPAKNTLYVEGSGLAEMPVAGGAAITIGGAPGGIDDLYGKYEVKSFTQDATGAIATIDLLEYPRELSSDQARSWLLGLTIVEFSVILLIVSNAAASTVTRRRRMARWTFCSRRRSPAGITFGGNFGGWWRSCCRWWRFRWPARFCSSGTI